MAQWLASCCLLRSNDVFYIIYYSILFILYVHCYFYGEFLLFAFSPFVALLLFDAIYSLPLFVVPRSVFSACSCSVHFIHSAYFHSVHGTFALLYCSFCLHCAIFGTILLPGVPFCTRCDAYLLCSVDVMSVPWCRYIVSHLFILSIHFIHYICWSLVLLHSAVMLLHILFSMPGRTATSVRCIALHSVLSILLHCPMHSLRGTILTFVWRCLGLYLPFYPFSAECSACALVPVACRASSFLDSCLLGILFFCCSLFILTPFLRVHCIVWSLHLWVVASCAIASIIAWVCSSPCLWWATCWSTCSRYAVPGAAFCLFSLVHSSAVR